MDNLHLYALNVTQNIFSHFKSNFCQMRMNINCCNSVNPHLLTGIMTSAARYNTELLNKQTKHNENTEECVSMAPVKHWPMFEPNFWPLSRDTHLFRVRDSLQPRYSTCKCHYAMIVHILLYILGQYYTFTSTFLFLHVYCYAPVHHSKNPYLALKPDSDSDSSHAYLHDDLVRDL